MTKVLVCLFAVTAAMFCTSCDSGTMKDKDGNIYKTVKIGDQVWMAENLNYETSSGSWCYDDDSSNCEKYGRLYDWETAKTVCPKGWRLPTKSDFETLLDNVGGDKEEAYNTLKDGGSSGFNALLAGWRESDGSFVSVDKTGWWWTSTEYTVANAWSMFVNNNEYTDIYNGDNKNLGLSVRCLQDN